MRFALIEDTRSEALPKLRGSCPSCGGEMIAKCGRVKVWHWAHKGRLSCDPWWENETEWHREWKSKFPVDWQEIVQRDLMTGEVHIADIKTPHGLVIEFQHSPIDPNELRAREAFYGDMIWIVDGNRGPLDGSYFNMGLSGPIQNDPLAYGIRWWSRGRLLHNWAEAGARVYLDFDKDLLWRLVAFDAAKNAGVVGPIHKKAVIEDCLAGRAIRVLAMDAE